MVSFQSIRSLIQVAICLVLAVPCLCQTPGKQVPSKEAREAERLWDAVINAKGGRERLQKVQNILIQYTENKQVTLIHLFVFPNKYWRWIYGPPFPEPAMDLYNGNPSYYYSISPNGAETVTGGDPQGWLEKESILLMLETKWLKPEPLRVTRRRSGKEMVDVIETRVGDERVDFVFEVESLLVTNVMRYSKKFKNGSQPWESIVYSDYANIDGIMMPMRESITDDGVAHYWRDVSYRFNVIHDPHFFDQPPSLSAGPEAWKLKQYH